MKIKSLKVLFVSSLLVVASASLAFAYECIAPANPGGGWDFTCRQISKVMHDLGAIDKPIQVSNMAGAGGGLAFNHVVAERNDDEKLIIAASSATTTRLAQNAYAGMTADQVRFVGAIGADPGVIVVAADSPYEDLNALVDAIKADPGSVAFARGVFHEHTIARLERSSVAAARPAFDFAPNQHENLFSRRNMGGILPTFGEPDPDKSLRFDRVR